MPEQDVFTPQDLSRPADRNLNADELRRQVEVLKKGPHYLTLNRPATLGDGVLGELPEDDTELSDEHARAAAAGRLMCFVPASGAATRMFQDPLRAHLGEPLDSEAGERMRVFMDELPQFAFFDHLCRLLDRPVTKVEDWIRRTDPSRILELLLTPQGLNLANLPKAFVPFHSYPEGSRTAFEEHFAEASHYIVDGNRQCRLHFTFSPEHIKEAEACLRKVKSRLEASLSVRFQVELSVQDPSTDTLAVDLENRPFRLDDGTLLRRPGGHGALLKNLRECVGELVFIKNVDNVVPDRLKPRVLLQKRLLCGLLLKIRKSLFRRLEKLKKSTLLPEELDGIADFARSTLNVFLPDGYSGMGPYEKQEMLMEKLNRPLRICGVVRNQGEPGGGPFWVTGTDGEPSLQIVESAQVDPKDERQQDIWRSATHFNPVDLVCGLRDFEGRPFDLESFRDPDAVFVSDKSHQGRPLKALELPGLWNGGMARWLTVFVEVPLFTFNPVKRVNDLLRENHRS